MTDGQETVCVSWKKTNQYVTDKKSGDCQWAAAGFRFVWVLCSRLITTNLSINTAVSTVTAFKQMKRSLCRYQEVDDLLLYGYRVRA